MIEKGNKRHSQWIKQIYRYIGFKLASLFQNTFVSPNLVTVLRLVFVIFASYLILINYYPYHLLASFFIFLFSMLDAMDGSLAVLKDQKSCLGAWLDPQIDRLGFLILFLSISYSFRFLSLFYTYLPFATLLMYYYWSLLRSDLRLKPKFEQLRIPICNPNEDKNKIIHAKRSFVSSVVLQTAPHTHNLALYVIFGLICKQLDVFILIAFLYLCLLYLRETVNIIKRAFEIDLRGAKAP